MPKRKSEEPLEAVSTIVSPNSKKARVEDIIEETPGQNGTVPKIPIFGEEREFDERNGNDILAAADEIEEELEEAAGRESDWEEDEEYTAPAPIRQKAPLEGYSDLYLDTINRAVLDFDFEKLCSVSLSNINVYACLVCGKYFQGRGPKSHAYYHALEVGHHVYINMETKKVYVLPEGYEVRNKSLDDIRYVVDPKYTEEDVKKLDKIAKQSTDLVNKKYRPGYVGMNNIKSNDYLNVVVQSLAHVPPLRNFFLLHPFDPVTTSQLPLRFSTLVRKLWNPRAFKSHVSPHELLQEVALRSSKRFTLTTSSDPVDFLSWFLNTLHLSLGGSKTRPQSSIIQRTFQGQLRIESQAITARADASGDRLRFEDSSTITSNSTPYLILTLDLPPAPLFQSQLDKNIIPQVPLTNLLQKYSGLVASEKLAHRVRHRLIHPLPPYLLFHIKRFSKNKFVAERNPTIVTFPSPRGLDMSPYVEPNPSFWPPGEPIYYEMVANVILDTTAVSAEDSSNAASAADVKASGPEKVAWKVQVRDKAAAVDPNAEGLPEWLEVQDLWVQRAEAETLFTHEGYLMVWERRKGQAPAQTKGKGKA